MNSDPPTCEIFGGYHEKNFIEKGIGGFKLDECDNSDYNPSNWFFPDSTSFLSGMDGEQMHNAIGVLYQKLLNRLYRNHGKRTASQVRSSGALLPLAQPVPYVDENTVFQVRIRFYGSGEGSFILYEDDFTGLAAEKGDYNTLTVTRDQVGRITWKREGKEPERYQIAGLWKEGSADGET